MKESQEYIIENIRKTLKDNTADTDKFVDMIVSAPRIFIYGVGRSGLIAKAFAIRLVQMGLEVFFVGETVTPIVEEKHLVIIVSHTGDTMSCVQTANIVRRVGADVISITSNDHSKLASASNLVVHIKPERDEDRKRLAPLGTLFEDATMIYFESIVAQVMQRLDQNEGSMRKRHAIWV